MSRNVFSVNHTHAPASSGDPDNFGGYKYVPSSAETDGFMAFARYSYGGYPLLGVEDWGVKGDHDMNDMIFYVKGVKTDNVKEVGDDVVKQSWLLLAEDLGSTLDLDFNDVVLGISHMSTNIDTESDVEAQDGGYDRITLTGLAAGGTLPVQILYDGKPISYYDAKATDIKYFHQWFGFDSPRVINAQGFNKEIVRSFNLSGIRDFHIAPDNDALHSGGRALQKFSIIVTKDGEEKELKQFWSGGEEGVGDCDLSAPQMLIIPAVTENGSTYNCKYPYELTPIYEAYPKFKEWIKDHNKSKDWYKEHNREQVVPVVNHGWIGEPF